MRAGWPAATMPDSSGRSNPIQRHRGYDRRAGRGDSLRPLPRWPRTDFWVRSLLQQFSSPTVDRQLSLEGSDLRLRCFELGALSGRDALLDPTVNPILASPVVDGLIADIEIASDVAHLAARCDQGESPLPELWGVALLSHAVLLSGQQHR